MNLFGTDGIRAPFGEAPLDQPTVVSIGARLAELLEADLGRSPTIVVGGDTRDSTPVLASWIAAGFVGRGGQVRFVGTIPTPGVAYLTPALGADAGVAISASHNPWPDNGIKLISAAGGKWPTPKERELEERLRNSATLHSAAHALRVDEPAAGAYRRHLENTLEDPRALASLRIVVDTANGAATDLAARVFERYGATVSAIGNTPDGRNINAEVGSTHPLALAAAVTAAQADLGIAFDGDADRAILVDEKGGIRDGDDILFIWAQHLAQQGLLRPPAIVATTMSNLGLTRALSRRGIEVVSCGVGDRAVSETMRRRAFLLGGEQSGHIVCSRFATTGDGILTALHLAEIVASSRQSLSELAADLRRFPQVLVNVRVPHKVPFEQLPAVVAMADRVERELGTEGRLVLRYSGTEPLARIMIEGPDLGVIESQAERIAAAIRESVEGAEGRRD